MGGWRRVLGVFDADPNVWTLGYVASPDAFQWYNFWWARASFAKTLPRPIGTPARKYYWESWLRLFGSCTNYTTIERPPDCVAYDPARLAHAYSLTDGATGVAQSAREAIVRSGTGVGWKRRV